MSRVRGLYALAPGRLYRESDLIACKGTAIVALLVGVNSGLHGTKLDDSQSKPTFESLSSDSLEVSPICP